MMAPLQLLPQGMPKYQEIRESCLALGQLWEDPDFPATQTSVFYYQTPPFDFLWKRPKELFSHPKLVDGDVFDVVPGKLGDMWLVSGFGILHMLGSAFRRVVPGRQNFDEPYLGVFVFRLWWCGEWVEVVVDDRLPTVNGKLAFLQPHHSDQLWPSLLEKAYAKLHGSYEALKYGNRMDGLADLTGGVLEAGLVADLPLASALEALLKTASVVTAVPHSGDASYKLNCPNYKYIKQGLNYRICYVQEVRTAEGPVDVVLLYRPPAPDDVQVSYIVEDRAKWRSIKERHMLTLPRYGFWMLFSEFRKVFAHLEVLHVDTEISRNDGTLLEKEHWHVRSYQGSWRRGVTAGGCRNYMEFFHINPQIQLILEEAGSVVISLNQHCIMEPRVIGFSVYVLNQTLAETASATFFQKFKSAIISQYTNSRQVSCRCELEPGAYLILPTTFKPRKEASFSLRVFSKHKSKLDVLDSPPLRLRTAIVRAPPGFEVAESFTQYEAVFLQLADEHKTLDAFELQELLDACLPNDYIKSCATIDTCRQIVLTLDTKGTGRISLSDFKNLICSLKYWVEVFRNHAKEKMGVLKDERLREALKEVGFILPQESFALLLVRYMRKDGMLRFGDFVSVVLHLQRCFNLFEECKTSSDNMTLNLSRWLHCSLMC